MNPTPEAVAAAAEAAGLPLPAAAAEPLARYLAELDRWSRRMNLTAVPSGERLHRLLLPALALGPLPCFQEADAFADLGSGNGIPGVPLQLAWPRGRCCLVEARARRAAFLRHLARTLPLTATTVVAARAETHPWPPEERVPLVVARAVAPPRRLLPWAEALLAPGGTVALWGPPEAVPGWRSEAAGPVTLYRRPCFT
ncbi:MAG: 16S rRNA (guanine(527)-N(7))-methyltransferase RsmG [Nitrospirae bacterium]|nr:MAG: 16S rRNA (guanine(527)-N(7))-methyltransferase RsmG [Nitrospirota bacterium]